MNRTFKLAIVASAVLAAGSAAYASQDDGNPDNAWLPVAVATLHMAPQVSIADNTPYSLNLRAPAPAAAAAGDPAVEGGPGSTAALGEPSAAPAVTMGHAAISGADRMAPPAANNMTMPVTNSALPDPFKPVVP